MLYNLRLGWFNPRRGPPSLVESTGFTINGILNYFAQAIPLCIDHFDTLPIVPFLPAVPVPVLLPPVPPAPGLNYRSGRINYHVYDDCIAWCRQPPPLPPSHRHICSAAVSSPSTTTTGRIYTALLKPRAAAQLKIPPPGASHRHHRLN